MAGDWIKMRVLMAADPKAVTIADFLAERREFMDWLTNPVQRSCEETAYEHVTRYVTVCVTVATLLRVWGVANERGKADGDDIVLHHATLDTINEIAGVPAFGEAMEHVGWVKRERGNGAQSLRFPDFMLYNTPNDQRVKSKNAERQKRYRERQKSNANGDVTRGATRYANRDDREDKSREYKTPPTPLEGGTSVLRDPIAKRWGIPDATEAQRRRLDRLVAEFESRGATAEQIERRAAAMAARWPNIPQSPETLAKHWAEFAEAAAPNRRELAAATCRESGHVYDHPADVGCSRCGTATLSRARELCGRYGHRPNARGACTRCGEGPAKADPAAGNGQHVNGEATVEVAR